MLLDDHSNFYWLLASPDTVVESFAPSIFDWLATFGGSKGLMSDSPAHFKNETLWLVAKGLRVPHHFTLPFAP